MDKALIPRDRFLVDPLNMNLLLLQATGVKIRLNYLKRGTIAIKGRKQIVAVPLKPGKNNQVIEKKEATKRKKETNY